MARRGGGRTWRASASACALRCAPCSSCDAGRRAPQGVALGGGGRGRSQGRSGEVMGETRARSPAAPPTPRPSRRRAARRPAAARRARAPPAPRARASRRPGARAGAARGPRARRAAGSGAAARRAARRLHRHPHRERVWAAAPGKARLLARGCEGRDCCGAPHSSAAAASRTLVPPRRDDCSRSSSGTPPASASGSATSRACATSACSAASSSHVVCGAEEGRSCMMRGSSAERPASWHAAGVSASSASVRAARSWQPAHSLHSWGSSACRAAPTRAHAARERRRWGRGSARGLVSGASCRSEVWGGARPGVDAGHTSRVKVGRPARQPAPTRGPERVGSGLGAMLVLLALGSSRRLAYDSTSWRSCGASSDCLPSPPPLLPP